MQKKTKKNNFAFICTARAQAGNLHEGNKNKHGGEWTWQERDSDKTKPKARTEEMLFLSYGHEPYTTNLFYQLRVVSLQIAFSWESNISTVEYLKCFLFTFLYIQNLKSSKWKSSKWKKVKNNNLSEGIPSYHVVILYEL